MSSSSFQLCLTLITGYFLCAALAGSGERDRDFLGKRPGPNKDVQLWNAFLRSESQTDHGVADEASLDQDLSGETLLGHGPSVAKRGGAFLDASIERGKTTSLKAALQSCLKAHFSTYLKPAMAMPMPMPGQSLAVVAASAAASLNAGTKHEENLIKNRLEACLETTQSDDSKPGSTAPPPKASVPPIVASENAAPFSGFGGRTKNAPQVKPALVTANVTSPCTKDLKQCNKDEKNCKHVLDILQFLRLQNIAVEKQIQNEADARKKHGLSLQSVLQKMVGEWPEDWHWTSENSTRRLLIQSALGEHGLALPEQPEQKASPVPPAGMMVHPLPDIPTHYHTRLPLKEFGAAMPVKLQNIRHHCSPQSQKDLEDCRSSLEVCKVDVDDHNSILNSIAGRAIQENGVKLQKWVHR